MNVRRWTCVLLMGCGAPGADTTSSSTPGPTSTTEPPDPHPAIDDLEALLHAAFDQARALDGAKLQRAYEQAMALGAAGCPSTADANGDSWFDSCTTPDGAQFHGYAYALGDDGTAGYGAYWYVSGEATILDPSGEQLLLGGDAGWGAYSDGTYDWVYHYAYGTFAADGASQQSPWLAGGDSVAFYAQLATDQTSGGHYAYLDGSLGGLLGDRAQAADFVDVEMWTDELNEDMGASCSSAPTGDVWLRTASGDWVEVILRCAPCGTALYGNEDLGSVCVDTSDWFEGEEQP